MTQRIYRTDTLTWVEYGQLLQQIESEIRRLRERLSPRKFRSKRQVANVLAIAFGFDSVAIICERCSEHVEN